MKIVKVVHSCRSVTADIPCPKMVCDLSDHGTRTRRVTCLDTLLFKDEEYLMGQSP